MRITITTDLKEFERQLTDFEKRQLPFAVAKALTATAKSVQTKIRADLPQVFDRPTPFTMNSMRVHGATKSNLSAELFVMDLQAKYLLPEQVGGARSPSMNTRKPEAAAIVMPGKAMKLDRYGGIPRGMLDMLRQAAAQNKAARAAWHAANREARAAKTPPPPPWPRDFGVFFWKKPIGGWASGGPGYFQRFAGHFLKRMTGFKRETHYQGRLDYLGRANRYANETFAAHLQRELAEAIKSAKP